MKKLLLFIAVAVFLVCGVLLLMPKAAPFEPPAPTVAPTPEPTPASTPAPTPEPTPEPTPNPLGSMELGDVRGWFTSESTGGYMDYYMYAPENARPGMPLVVFLHGDGYVGLPDDLIHCGPVTAAKKLYGDELPFILLCPATQSFSWTDYNIPATLFELIDHIAGEYLCDREHIAITGHSRGAIGVWTIVSQHPGYFSAAVPVSCPSVGFNPESFMETPLRALVGDSYNDYGNYGQLMQNHVDGLKLVGAEAELIIMEDCSHGEAESRAYTGELFEWMLSR